MVCYPNHLLFENVKIVYHQILETQANDIGMVYLQHIVFCGSILVLMFYYMQNF